MLHTIPTSNKRANEVEVKVEVFFAYNHHHSKGRIKNKKKHVLKNGEEYREHKDEL